VSVPKKRERLSEFAYPPGGSYAFSSLSPDLLWSAGSLLERALWDRQKFARNAQTHASQHGGGAIVLAVTAFDVWLGELIVGLMLSEDETRAQLDVPTVAKYRFVGDRYGVVPPLETADLETIVAVRHEVVHHFIRPDVAKLPSWFSGLQAKGLLVTHPSAPEGDFSLTQKLGSYALAYWGFEVLESAAKSLIEKATNVRAQIHSGDLYNFGLYRRFCAPKHLAIYDRDHPPRERPAG
jgi:hypothetical protein